MIETRRYRQILLIVVCVGLLAALAVAAWRARDEHRSRRVEIAMDAQDFLTFAHAYGYDPAAFLVALRRAGLTSLAVTEELGGAINGSSHGVVYSGQQLLDQQRLAPVTDPAFGPLLREHRVRPDWVYVEAFDEASYRRYLEALRRYFQPHDVVALRGSPPYVVAAKTNLDYFNTLALGLPADELALTRKLRLFLIPRVQNDERYSPASIDRIFGGFMRHEYVSTVIFFGLRNEVLGYPDQLRDTAADFKLTHVNFGTIEVYARDQEQKGNLGLARLIPNQVVRVQAISKLELDKLTLPQIVARYALGARERNIRVVYLRPYQHRYQGMSIEATNVAMVSEIRSALERDGLVVGRATPFPHLAFPFPLLLVISLAVPGGFLLLIEVLRAGGRTPAPGERVPPAVGRWAIVLFAATVVLMGGTAAIHHALLGRKLAALAGGLTYGTLAFTTLAPQFSAEDLVGTRASLLAGLRTLAVTVGAALLGGLVIVGLLSNPLFMTEVEAFSGVKLLLLVIPLAALAIALYAPAFGTGLSLRNLDAPVRAWQLLAGIAVIGLGAVITLRSGNQSDIGPTALETHLRSGLTHFLVVRPRFKEFLIGWPSIVVLCSLRPSHRRWLGWLLALGAGVGIGDVVDTYSHLHTALWVSTLRTVNGLVLGALIGLLVAWLYRRFVPGAGAAE